MLAKRPTVTHREAIVRPKPLVEDTYDPALERSISPNAMTDRSLKWVAISGWGLVTSVEVPCDF